MLLKNLSLLACERKLQDLSLSQKKCVIPQIHSGFHEFSPIKPKTRQMKCVIPQIHSGFHEFSPIKPKTRVVWVRKDLLR